jgi:hypothetical protein
MGFVLRSQTRVLSTPPWLLSGWGCPGRRPSREGGNPCRQRALGCGLRRNLLHADSLPQGHWRERLPAAPSLPSSSSIRCRCGRESFETRRRQRYLVQLPGMHLRAHTLGREERLLTNGIVPSSREEAACRAFRAESGFLASSASCAWIAGSQSDCICVSSGKRFCKSWASDSARFVSPAMANASAASAATPGLAGTSRRDSVAARRASEALP